MTNWKETRCHSCSGHGMVAAYSVNDFEGCSECSTCSGTGRLFQSDKGTLVQYPGGPFAGSTGKAVHDTADRRERCVRAARRGL